MGCMTAPREVISPKGSKILQAPAVSPIDFSGSGRVCVHLQLGFGASGSKVVLYLYYHLHFFSRDKVRHLNLS